MSEYRLQMKGISKSFPGVKALDNVNLDLRPGTVHALMGENGAGKSTLMKCLFGIYHKDSGEIYIDGEKVDIKNPDDALKKGLAMVHQELQPVPARNIGENMYLGRYPLKKIGPFSIVDHKKMFEDTKKALNELKMDFNPKALLGSLSISQMQTIEIAKAVSHGAKVIILDEPTSSLTDNEVQSLFKIINDLRDNGVSLVYISHKMAEIRQIADDITIMRDGTYVGTWHIDDINDDEIVKQMVGRELKNIYPHRNEIEKGEVLLEVKDVTSVNPKSFKNISFSLRRGEIIGFGGLVGAQRSELMEAIFGLRGIASGEIFIKGKKVKINNPSTAINNGIGMITEDRRGTGIFGCLSISDNVAISSLRQYIVAGVAISYPKLLKIVKESIDKLRIKTPSANTLIQNLSGGNQQKVIIARWLASNPDILIMDEPTRGIDVGAKYEIYQIMLDLVNQGKAIIMISSEMSELIGMSDRILVMCNGKLTGEVNDNEATQEIIMSFATQF